MVRLAPTSKSYFKNKRRALSQISPGTGTSTPIEKRVYKTKNIALAGGLGLAAAIGAKKLMSKNKTDEAKYAAFADELEKISAKKKSQYDRDKLRRNTKGAIYGYLGNIGGALGGATLATRGQKNVSFPRAFGGALLGGVAGTGLGVLAGRKLDFLPGNVSDENLDKFVAEAEKEKNESVLKDLRKNYGYKG